MGDLVSESAQQHYINTCEKLRTGDGYDGKLTRQNKLDPQSAECHCFLNDAVDYYNDLSGEESPGNNKTLPTDPAEFRRVLNDFLETSDGRKRASQIGLDRSKDDKPYFATIVCNSSVLDTWAPYVMFEPYEAAQEKFVETTNKECEVDGMKSMFQTAGMWVRNATQRTYLSDAIYGILMSLGLAFLILFLSTANIIVAVLSLINIGSIESICLTILVGLSVDYVVHLANCYMEAPFSDRQRRVTSALGEMGVTVLGGAITSL